MLLLLTRPKYDTATHYLYHWSQILLNEAREKNVEVVDLERKKACKKIFQSHLKKRPIDTVVINGHGNDSSVWGNEEEILSTTDGVHLFGGKNVFIRACDSGAILGPVLMQSGAQGFVGYSLPFIFPLDEDFTHDPTNDPLAGPILECSNKVALSLIRGRSTQEAHEDSMEKYAEKFDELSSSKSAMSYILPFLLWNMDAQVCY